MNSKFKNHAFILFAYVGSIVVSTVLGATILIPICNAIWGDETSGGSGTIATQIIMRLLVPIFAFVLIYFRKKNNREEYRNYIANMREQEYTIKQDIKELMKNKNLWTEVIFVSIITIIYWAMNYVFPWIFINIPLFILFEFAATIRIHSIWLDS